MINFSFMQRVFCDAEQGYSSVLATKLRVIAGLFGAVLLTLRAALRAFCDAAHLVNRFQRFLLTNVRPNKNPHAAGMRVFIWWSLAGSNR